MRSQYGYLNPPPQGGVGVKICYMKTKERKEGRKQTNKYHVTYTAGQMAEDERHKRISRYGQV